MNNITKKEVIESLKTDRFYDIPREFTRDEDVLETAYITKHKYFYTDVPADMRPNKRLAIASLNATWRNVEDFEYILLKDIDVAKKAISINPYTLDAFRNEIKDNLEVVCHAIRLNPETIMYASDRIKNDRKCVLTILKNNYKTYDYIDEKFKYDSAVIDVYWTGYLKEIEENLYNIQDNLNEIKEDLNIQRKRNK